MQSLLVFCHITGNTVVVRLPLYISEISSITVSRQHDDDQERGMRFFLLLLFCTDCSCGRISPMASFLLLVSLSLLGGSSDGARASHQPPHRAANVGRHLLGDCSQTPTCTVLPAIWSRHLHANSGCDYYYNAITQESTWDSPPCPPPRPDADPPLSPSTPAATMFRTSGPGVLSTEMAVLATTSAAPTTTRATRSSSLPSSLPAARARTT